MAILTGQIKTDDDILRIAADVKYEQALCLSDENPEKPLCLMHAGQLYDELYNQLDRNADLDKAIAVYNAAVKITPDGHQCQAELHGQLGNILLMRIAISGEMADINDAIFAFECSLMLTPDGDAIKPIYLTSLGISLLSRFQQLGDLVDVDNAIMAQEQAVHLTPDGHSHKPTRLCNLGLCLLGRFEQSEDLVDIDKAITAQEQAVHLAHANKPRCLHDLGQSFLGRFKRSGDLVDVDNAITAQEQAVHLTPDEHPAKPDCFNSLGNSFLAHFGLSGDLVDVNKAITAQEQAIHLTHANKPSYLNDLGESLLSRFNRSGDLVDVDRAITAQEQAVHLTSDGDSRKPRYLGGLGNSLIGRFEQSNNLVDVDKAITVQEQAVHLIPDGHAKKPGYLSSLGNSLFCHFLQSGDLVDIDKAITVQEQAVHLTPDGHSAKPVLLSNLGNSLACRFEQFKDPVDIIKAVTAHEQAVHLTPDGHANKLVHLNNFGRTLTCRYRQSGDLVDIDKAITALEQAVHLTPDGHPRKPGLLINLGNSLKHCSEKSGDFANIDKGISAFKNAATHSTGSPLVRFEAALEWARLASTVDASFALHGYTVALNLLPQIAWLGQTVQAQHKELISVGHIASEAASAAISVEQYNTALEWLEQGRSIVWNQLLQLHTPVDALWKVQPSLASDLVNVSKALEHAIGATTNTQNLSTPSNKQIPLEQAAQDHRRLAEKWEMLVKKTRDIPGFEDFLQPKKMEKLCKAADSGPVVVVNIHKHRCDALILMAGLDEVMLIPLESFSYNKAQKMHLALNQLLLHSGVRARATMIMRHATTITGIDFPSILSDLWLYIVKPVLDGLAITVSYLLLYLIILWMTNMAYLKASHVTDPPHIWWCMTGPLAFLPVHAAGIYNKSAIGFNIFDYVVSSYTPTLNALINATQNHKTRQNFLGLLAVSQPNTPGQNSLPNTTLELTHIQNQAHNCSVHCLEGPEASVENVVKGMEVHSWVHFACHAVQDTKEPTRSAFCLYDGHLELSTIITKSFPHAEFAFLSACQTATGEESLSEEAVHLAAGLMLAGYHGVIATMWSIKDKDAPIIADHVYKKLFSETEPDSTKAALALHHAIKVLRQQVGDSAFLSWVPFVHIGV